MAVILTSACQFLYFTYRLNKLRREAIEAVQAFMLPQAEGEPSKLAAIVYEGGRVVSGELIKSLKGALMGQSSALARAESAIEGDVFQDAVDAKSPLLGMLLEQFPRLKKRLLKSPAAAMALGQMDLGSLLKGGAATGSEARGNGGHHGPWEM